MQDHFSRKDICISRPYYKITKKMDQEDTGGEQEKKPTNLEPFHSVTQPADDETVVLMDNILRYPLPESASTVSTHLTWDWHVTANPGNGTCCHQPNYLSSSQDGMAKPQG